MVVTGSELSPWFASGASLAYIIELVMLNIFFLEYPPTRARMYSFTGVFNNNNNLYSMPCQSFHLQRLVSFSMPVLLSFCLSFSAASLPTPFSLYIFCNSSYFPLSIIFLCLLCQKRPVLRLQLASCLRSAWPCCFVHPGRL